MHYGPNPKNFLANVRAQCQGLRLWQDFIAILVLLLDLLIVRADNISLIHCQSVGLVAESFCWMKNEDPA